METINTHHSENIHSLIPGRSVAKKATVRNLLLCFAADHGGLGGNAASRSSPILH